MNIKDITVATNIWYKEVPCYIDAICSGKIFKAEQPSLRIVPNSGETERVGDIHSDVILQQKGEWKKIDDVHLSSTPPPEKVIWPKTKSNIIGKYDINMYKKLVTLLVKGKQLILKFDDGDVINVTMDSEGDILHDAHIKTELVLEAMSKRKDYSDWYVIDK
jgi:hypothetical protein